MRKKKYTNLIFWFCCLHGYNIKSMQYSVDLYKSVVKSNWIYEVDPPWSRLGPARPRRLFTSVQKNTPESSFWEVVGTWSRLGSARSRNSFYLYATKWRLDLCPWSRLAYFWLTKWIKLRILIKNLTFNITVRILIKPYFLLTKWIKVRNVIKSLTFNITVRIWIKHLTFY